MFNLPKSAAEIEVDLQKVEFLRVLKLYAQISNVELYKQKFLQPNWKIIASLGPTGEKAWDQVPPVEEISIKYRVFSMESINPSSNTISIKI